MAVKRPFVGELNTKVQIHRMAVVPNEMMEREETPQLVCDTWANVYSAAGTEVVDTKVESNSKSVYVIRNRPGVTANEKLTLTDGATKFNITHVSKLYRAYLIITCESYG